MNKVDLNHILIFLQIYQLNAKRNPHNYIAMQATHTS